MFLGSAQNIFSHPIKNGHQSNNSKNLIIANTIQVLPKNFDQGD
jgi:hypothetical protein